ncbi:alanyl-tRNA synthetase [Clostridium cavendishii DSM 21758]|uniref:Alanine--tRNA ligase n=1 Tax=Clostridium cavendishii DSM 21758 TaxID=1121302 RepID=A0A1M6M0N0_9CLOT|nr:DHHA1 domain-containing protein [Clostridium cavendishii]SHJ76936.1 alanyl-tRNA synthetase [Clostridium cavendishii DSM 21758]
MEKIYYENQYIKDFVCEIEEVKEADGKFHVVLDKTAFFPGGGGQHEDVGHIDGLQVLEVYEEDGVIYHVMDKKPNRIHKVKASIDWENRFDGMQQHLAQHVLSGCFFSMFNANTVGFHMGKEISTVDIEGILTEETIRKAEKAANDVIRRNLNVQFLTPTKSELKKIRLRRALPKTNEQIRVVVIEDLDINACCGVHPNSTLELQAIKIRRWEKHKGATRIEYVAGGRAIEDYFDKDSFTREVCRYLNCSSEDAIKAIQNLSNTNKGLYMENKKIKAIVGDYEIKTMVEEAEMAGEALIIKNVYENEDTKYISKIANKIVDENKAVVLFASINEDKVNLVFMCSKNLKGISMNDLLKDAITLIDGRGGGSNFAAQGAGKNSSNLNSLMDYAIMKIKNLLG